MEIKKLNLFIKCDRQNKTLHLVLVAVFISFNGYLIFDRYTSEKMMPATIEPYKFTDIGIGDLYVNGTWGGNSYPHTGGGHSVCCVLIPEKWRPGLVVNIKWIRGDGNPKQYSYRAEVPPYAESGALQVLFLDNDIIKVYVNDYWPCTPMHPMPKSNLCERIIK